MLFVPGQIVATRGAVMALDEAGVNPATLIARHVAGDWGVLDAEDTRTNVHALEVGQRVLSKYVEGGSSFYVITEADRSITTLLLVEEY